MYKGLKKKRPLKVKRSAMTDESRYDETFTSIYRKRYRHSNQPHVDYRNATLPNTSDSKDLKYVPNHLLGLNFPWRKDLDWFERMCWAFILAASVSTGVFLVLQLYGRFRSSAACVTSLQNTNYPVWNIPFPAVTLCNENKVYKPFTYKILSQFSLTLCKENKVYKPFTYKILSQLKLLGINETMGKVYLRELASLVQPKDFENITAELLHVDDIVVNKIGKSIGDLMYQVSQPCSHMLVSCRWLDKDIGCGKIFRKIKTVEGFCCSFNYHHEYDSTTNITVIDEEGVLRVSGSGTIMGLSVTLDSEPENHFASHESADGIQIIIHKPTMYADTSIITYPINTNEELHLSLDATIVQADSTVKDLGVAQRGCYFADEINLASFGYSYQTCVTECKMRAIMTKCGCLPFYYPNMFNARECSVRDVACMKQNNGLFTSLGPPSLENEEFPCNCLSECSEILYEVYPQLRHGSADPDDESEEKEKSDHTHLHVYFRDSTCVMYRRYVNFTWPSFIASLGGVLALCMGGASLLTLAEILLISLKQCKGWVHSARQLSKPQRPNNRRVMFLEPRVRY